MTQESKDEISTYDEGEVLSVLEFKQLELYTIREKCKREKW